MQKIILFYKFVPLHDPESVLHWQKVLCESLSLKGRVLISNKGINGTLGGDFKALRRYTRTMKEHSLLDGIAYKWSDGSAADFPKLSVKVRSETVTLGLPDGVKVDTKGVVNGGKRLKPHNLDEFVADNPDAVLFDGRNNYESAIGKFKGAITPDIRHFKDLPAELDKPQYNELKAKKVVTYCTGGIRCETLSALMRKKGFKDVYQLDGGIVSYGRAKGDEGLWEGKCFVFDKRLSVSFGDKTEDIGSCVHCCGKTSHYTNCANKSCNELILVCLKCERRTYCTLCASQMAAV